MPRPLHALAALAWLLTAAALAEPLTVTVPGQPPVAIETVEVNGIDHITYDDLRSIVRRVDPAAEFRWDNAQTLRATVFGTRVSLFTDRALILVETRLHPTPGPLLTQAGAILVPAADLRILFEQLPGAPVITVQLPTPAARPPQPVSLPPLLPPTTATPAPQIPTSTPSPPVATPSPQLPSPPAPPPISLPPRETTNTVALVTIGSPEDQALMKTTADLLSERIGLGTGCRVITLSSAGDAWEDVVTSLERERPRLVIALQVGHSAQGDLRGLGAYTMSPLVDFESQGDVSTASQRYRAAATQSDLAARLIEREVQRAGLRWLGRVAAPHRLLRRCAAPAVLIEVGQATNPEDLAMLADSGQQALIAGALAQAAIDLLAPSPSRDPVPHEGGGVR